MTLRPINPPELGEPSGWTNGFLSEPGARMLFIAGQTARGEDGRIVDGGMAAQWDVVLGNLLKVAGSAGANAERIARMTIYVTDLDAYRAARKELGRVWQKHMGRHYPAMTLVAVAGLVDQGALVEIEATAVVSSE